MENMKENAERERERVVTVIDRKHLVNSLVYAKETLMRRGGSEMDKQVLFDADGETLKLKSIHLYECGRSIEIILGKSAAIFKNLVVPKGLIAFCKSIRETEIRICSTVNENNQPVFIVSGDDTDYETKPDNALDSDDYPVNPECQQIIATIQAADFMTMYEKVVFCAAKEERKYAMNGVHLEIKNGKMEWCATDGHRLAVLTHKATTSGMDCDLIIPVQTLELIKKISKVKYPPTIKLCYEKNGRYMSWMINENIVITCDLVEGNFPRYRDVIPKDTENKMILDREQMKTVCMIGKKLGYTCLVVDETFCRLSGPDNPGTIRKDILRETGDTGDMSRIAMTTRFLLELIGIHDENRIELEYEAADRPILYRNQTLSGAESVEYVYVFMPIRPR